MIFLRLYWEFFKVGLFSIGGGLATLPFLYDLGTKTGWFTVSDVADMLAVSESTPGPIGVNMATFTGFRCAGVTGGVIATLGLVTPSLLIILLIAAALRNFRHNRYVEGAFYTLRPASTGLIASAGFSVLTLVLLNTERFAQTRLFSQLFRWESVALFAVLMVLTNLKKLKKLHPAAFLGAAAVLGIVLRLGEL